MIDWGDFRIILAISEGRTLSAAARRLAVNQSTLSRALKRIEANLKAPVFTSSTDGYELTREGRNYFKIAKEIEKSVSRLDGSVRQSQIRGQVRLTSTETFVGYLLSRIAGFQKQFPGVSLELNGSNERAHLPRRVFHAALRLEREEKSKSLLIKKVADIGISLYRKRGPGASDEWIGYESTLADIPEEKWLKAKTKTRHHPTHVGSYGTMEKAIQQGLGKGLMPMFLGENNSELERVTGPRPLLLRSIWFITHPDFRQDPAMGVFAQWLFKQFNEDRLYLLG